jgi:hypothetical protein
MATHLIKIYLCRVGLNKCNLFSNKHNRMVSIKTGIMATGCKDWGKSENDFNRPLGGDFNPQTSEHAAGMLTGVPSWMV